MAEYDNTNRGSLFIQENKQTEKSPDFSGNLNVEGKEYRLSAWKRTSKTGKKFLSVSISEPQSQGPNQSKPAAKDDDSWGI
jgi:uncharacterized protein (DUF736 family)